MYCSLTNLKYSKIIYAYCVPTQSTVSSPNLLRSRIHPSLHLRSDFRPYFPFFFFFIKSKTGSVGLQATEKVKVHFLSRLNWIIDTVYAGQYFSNIQLTVSRASTYIKKANWNTSVLLLDLHFKNYEDKSVKLACFVKETASYICNHLGRGELEQVTTYIPVSRAPRHSWKSTSKGWEKIDIIVHNSPFLLNDTGTDLKTETCRSKFFTKPSPLYAPILVFLFFLFFLNVTGKKN